MPDAISARSWIHAALDTGLGRPIIPDPIPALVLDAVPKDYRSFSIIPDYFADETLDEMRRTLEARLAAEDERLRRLLPPPPNGFEWQPEISWSTEFEGLRAESALRFRYRLRSIAVDRPPDG